VNFQNEYNNLDLTKFYLRILKMGSMISKSPMMISEIMVRTLEHTQQGMTVLKETKLS